MEILHMSILDTIFENEDFKNYMTENEEVMTEAEGMINDFPKVLKSFVLGNPKEFLAENEDQTKKNIKVFAEVATAQYIQEVSSMLAESIEVPEVKDALTENSAISAYL
jgi:hypothetical protein